MSAPEKILNRKIEKREKIKKKLLKQSKLSNL